MSIKYNNCIHCDLPPYPVCPDCGGYWSVGYGAFAKHKGCILCGYVPTEEQLVAIAETVKKYKELVVAEQSFKQEAKERYDKLHTLFMKTIKQSSDPRELLALTKALEIARAEADGL